MAYKFEQIQKIACSGAGVIGSSFAAFRDKCLVQLLRRHGKI